MKNATRGKSIHDGIKDPNERTNKKIRHSCECRLQHLRRGIRSQKIGKRIKKIVKQKKKLKFKIHCTDHDLYCTEKSKQRKSKKYIHVLKINKCSNEKRKLFTNCNGDRKVK